MGICSSCFKGASTETGFTSPDIETRRRMQIEAAEKRQKEQIHRGIKDPERVRRMQELAEEKDKKLEEALKKGQGGGGGLKWQVN